MKNAILLLLFTCLFSSHSEARVPLDTLHVQTRFYCDHCKECESCQRRLEEALVYTKGVRAMSIDETTMTISVVYRARRIQPEEIRKVIAAQGFDADELPADPQAVKRLDTCCKPKD